jgi:hypothetical protein
MATTVTYISHGFRRRKKVLENRQRDVEAEGVNLLLVLPPMNQPKRQNIVARMSTSKMAPVSCHDGILLQKGPFALVMKISQFSDSELGRVKS